MDMKKYAAEAIGTFWLTFAGCGSAVIAAGFPQVGIGLVGVSLAFGLSVVTMAYAIGHISGCHLNPAVTLAIAIKTGEWGKVPYYLIGQFAGAMIGAVVRAGLAVSTGASCIQLRILCTNGSTAFSPSATRSALRSKSS